MKTHVVLIHGGETFKTHDEYISYLRNLNLSLEKLKQKKWADVLQERLGDDFEVLRPQMPCKQNSRYSEWKILFEKIIPLLNKEVIFVGHSLGGIFLAKYLAENPYPGVILATFLIAAPYDMEGKYDLVDFSLPDKLDGFAHQNHWIYLYHSKDDPVVPFSDFGKYYSKFLELTPATLITRILTDQGHINQVEFPELVMDIKKFA